MSKFTIKQQDETTVETTDLGYIKIVQEDSNGEHSIVFFSPSAAIEIAYELIALSEKLHATGKDGVE